MAAASTEVPISATIARQTGLAARRYPARGMISRPTRTKARAPRATPQDPAVLVAHGDELGPPR